MPASPARVTRRVRGKHHAPPAPHRAVDPGFGLLQARRGGARGRGRRRRLDPPRRDGRAFRAGHHLRAGRGEGAAPDHAEDARRPSDDRAGRSASRSLRQGRRRHHHRACRGRPASAPLAAGDPRARQEGRRHHEPGDAGRDDRARHRPGRSGAGDVGQSGLRRPEVHPGGRGKDPPGRGAGRRPADRHRDRRRRDAGQRRARHAGRRQRAGRGLGRVQGRRLAPIAPTSRRSAMPPRSPVARRRDRG